MSDLTLSPAASTQNLTQARSTQALNILQSPKNGDSAKIDKAAKDFESILIGEWLEKAEKSFGSVPGPIPIRRTIPATVNFRASAASFWPRD